MKEETEKKNIQQNALVIFHYEFLQSGIWLSARTTQTQWLPDNKMQLVDDGAIEYGLNI